MNASYSLERSGRIVQRNEMAGSARELSECRQRQRKVCAMLLQEPEGQGSSKQSLNETLTTCFVLPWLGAYFANDAGTRPFYQVAVYIMFLYPKYPLQADFLLYLCSRPCTKPLHKATESNNSFYFAGTLRRARGEFGTVRIP